MVNSKFNKFKMIKFILIGLALLSLGSPATFNEFKAEMEQKVTGLATFMESVFANRCRSAITAC